MAFINRVVEHPGRVQLTDVSTGEVLGVFDVTRVEGEVTEEGTPLNADNLNNEVTTAISEALDSNLSAFSIDNNRNVNVRNIQRGTALVTAKKNQVAKKAVTFPQVFTRVPSVVIVPVSAAPNQLSYSITNVTTRGFEICMYRVNNTNTGFHWIAVL